MRAFIQNPEEALAQDELDNFRFDFYRRKMNLVVGTPEGNAQLAHLCRSYLQGLQWVRHGPAASSREEDEGLRGRLCRLCAGSSVVLCT